MPSQSKLIKQGIYLTDNVFDEIIQRVEKGVKASDTLEHFLSKYKEYTNGNGENNPLVINGYKEKMLDIILKETNNHKFSRPSQKELVRVTIENRVGDLIVDVGDDIKNSVRDIIKEGYNNNLSQDEIAENITHRVNVIKNTRARTIARTEIARTATASDYVINKERGATHFTVDCRDTCCGICARDYNWGKIEYTIDQVEMLPPRHPNCCCVAMFFIKEGYGNNANFSNETSADLNALFDNIYDGKIEGKPFYMDENEFKRLINDIIDEKDINKVVNLFYLFKKDLPQLEYEWGVMHTNYDSIVAFGEKNKKKVNIPLDLEEDCIENGALIIIHNHPAETSPFASPEDFNTYAKLGIEYGITTNELGTFIVKNKAIKKNKGRYDDVESAILDIKDQMVKDFSRDIRDISDKSEKEWTLEDKKELNKYVTDHVERYEKLYQSALRDLDFEVKFINH